MDGLPVAQLPTAYRELALEQQERIAKLTLELANEKERFLTMSDVAFQALAEFGRAATENSRLRAVLRTVEKAESLEEARAVARGVVRRG